MNFAPYEQPYERTLNLFFNDTPNLYFDEMFVNGK